MIITSYNFRSQYYGREKISFEGKKPIDLNYIIKNRENLLPQRIAEKIKKILSEPFEKLPTLEEVHKETYAPLLQCKTLQEAKELFPEFSEIKEVTEPFTRITGNIKILQNKGNLREGLSLELLQEIWGKLTNFDDVAEKIGLSDRHSMDWILKKIEFVKFDKNYKNLISSSTQEGHAKKSLDTKTWNANHPDLILARNKKAAQGNKKPETRKAQSDRIKQFYNNNPERRQLVSEKSKKYWSDPQNRKDQSERCKIIAKEHPEKAERNRNLTKSAWAIIPEGKEILKKFFKDYISENKVLGGQLKRIFKKLRKKQELTPAEEIIYGKYNRACADANKDVWKMLSDAFKKLREEK